MGFSWEIIKVCPSVQMSFEKLPTLTKFCLNLAKKYALANHHCACILGNCINFANMHSRIPIVTLCMRSTFTCGFRSRYFILSTQNLVMFPFQWVVSLNDSRIKIFTSQVSQHVHLHVFVNLCYQVISAWWNIDI